MRKKPNHPQQKESQSSANIGRIKRGRKNSPEKTRERITQVPIRGHRLFIPLNVWIQTEQNPNLQNTDVYLNPPRQSLQDSRYRRAHGLGGSAVAYRSKKQQPHRLGRQIIIRVRVNCSQFEGKERDFGSDEFGECKSKRDEGCDGLSRPGGWGVSWVWRVLAWDWWRR